MYLYYRDFAQSVRVVFGRKSVETGLKEEISSRNTSLDDEFIVKDIPLKFKPKKKAKNSEEDEVSIDQLPDKMGCLNITRPLVVVKELDNTLAGLMLNRKLDPGRLT